MRRDSNPRWTFAHSGFQDRRLRPLGHASKSSVAETPSLVGNAYHRRKDYPPNSLLRRERGPSSERSQRKFLQRFTRRRKNRGLSPVPLAATCGFQRFRRASRPMRPGNGGPAIAHYCIYGTPFYRGGFGQPAPAATVIARLGKGEPKESIIDRTTARTAPIPGRCVSRRLRAADRRKATGRWPKLR